MQCFANLDGEKMSDDLEEYSKEEAMAEARDIMSGKKKTKHYSKARDLFDELDKEED